MTTTEQTDEQAGDPAGRGSDQRDPNIAPDSIGIAAPREWIQVPVDRESFERFQADLDKRWTKSNEDRTTRRQAELLLNRIRRELRRVGVQYASLYISEPTEEDVRLAEESAAEHGLVAGASPESVVEDDLIMMACCTVGYYSQEELGAKIDLSLGNLVMAYGKRPDRDDPNTRERITNLEPPMLHDLPAGKSVRLRRLYELPEPGMLPQRYYGETYLTPTSESGSHLLITNFITINLPLARVFSELFESMAGTVELFYPDEPTRFESDWVVDPGAD